MVLRSWPAAAGRNVREQEGAATIASSIPASAAVAAPSAAIIVRVRRRCLLGSRLGLAGLPAERAEHLVGRVVRAVGQGLLEPLLVVGLDPLHVRNHVGLRRGVLHLLDLAAQLVVLAQLVLVFLGHAGGAAARRGGVVGLRRR